MWWWGLALAFGQDLDGRMMLTDALLDQAAHGDHLASVEVYGRLARELPVQDPLRGDALYWLGHAHHLLGNPEAAREALREGIRTDLCPTRCRDLLEAVELEQARATELPLVWSFDAPDHGLFHPWRFGDRGPVQLQQGALMWTTLPDPRQYNRLVMGFDEVGPVAAIGLDLEARGRDMRLQVVVTDRRNRQFGLPDALRLRAGQRAQVRLEPRDFVPVEEGSGVLDRTAFAELWLVDITPQGSQVTLAIHQLEVR